MVEPSQRSNIAAGGDILQPVGVTSHCSRPTAVTYAAGPTSFTAGDQHLYADIEPLRADGEGLLADSHLGSGLQPRAARSFREFLQITS
jgi:hypothetical protein